MPGKLNVGLDALSVGTQSTKSKVAKAYCEGRAANQDGVLQSANPDPDPKGETFISWDQGWQDANVFVPPTGCAR